MVSCNNGEERHPLTPHRLSPTDCKSKKSARSMAARTEHTQNDRQANLCGREGATHYSRQAQRPVWRPYKLEDLKEPPRMVCNEKLPTIGGSWQAVKSQCGISPRQRSVFNLTKLVCCPFASRIAHLINKPKQLTKYFSSFWTPQGIVARAETTSPLGVILSCVRC